jgi:hypothetical protein
VSSKGRKDRSKKDPNFDPELDSENPIRKQLDEIVERISAENRAFGKILKEMDKNNKED